MPVPTRKPVRDANDRLERCDVTIVDLPRVRRARKRIEPADVLDWSAETLKALADPTRLRLVRALMLEQRLCVCDLAAVAGVSQSAVSHQLRILRAARLVRAEREGRMVYYRLDDEHVNRIVRTVIEHVQHP
jgi:DNA-binding transcriptional ArsR family regulator